MKKIKIEIRHRWTGNILFEYEKENNTIKDTIEQAIKRRADLREADLRRADLEEADLREADLRGAVLRRADLREADLRGAVLRRADLEEADLEEADLRGADLRGADLEGANLRRTNLDKKEKKRLGKIIDKKTIVYKKCQDKIVELELQKGSIVFSINNKKCRTNKAKVISINKDTTKGLTIASDYDKNFIYEVGKTIKIKDFDLMYNVECSTGIHFFYKKEDAENY